MNSALQVGLLGLYLATIVVRYWGQSEGVGVGKEDYSTGDQLESQGSVNLIWCAHICSPFSPLSFGTTIFLLQRS